MPRPAATGNRKREQADENDERDDQQPQTVPLAHLAILQIADFVLDFFFGRACADQPCGGPQVAGDNKALSASINRQHPDHDEHEHARDPECLGNDGRRLEARIDCARPTSRTGQRRPQAVPGGQREKSPRAGASATTSSANRSFLRKQDVKRIDADVGAVKQCRSQPPHGGRWPTSSRQARRRRRSIGRGNLRISTSTPISTAASSTSAPAETTVPIGAKRTHAAHGPIDLYGVGAFRPSDLPNRVVPLLGALRATALGPTGEHGTLDQLLVGPPPPPV